MIQNWRLISLG
jgi:hypothetical protein